MKPPSTPAALLKLENAMVQVERAQQMLGRATQDLSSLRYGADLYKKAGKLYDQVHALWYVLDKAHRQRGRMSVDSEPEVK